MERRKINPLRKSASSWSLPRMKHKNLVKTMFVLIQFGPPGDEHLLLETCRGIK
jgi:hypothetical protein